MIDLLITFELPSWLIWTAYGITMYLFLSIFPFGCPYCAMPDLAWGPKLVTGAVTLVLWKLNLWPEKWTDYCESCGDVIPPTERHIKKYKPDYGDFKVCDIECSKNLDQELEDKEDG